MRKLYTQEEIAIIRLAFNSSGKIGTLQSIVSASWKNNKGLVADQGALIVFYNSQGCENIAKLIQNLLSVGMLEIGSASIDFLGVAGGPFSLENAMSMQELRIGSRSPWIDSVTWLAHLSEGFAELPTLQKEGLDKVCGNFLLSFDMDSEN